jgi:hypothetical protein
MAKNINKHFWHYVVYSIIFGGGLQLILLSNHDRELQALYIVMTAILYFIWSMVHHYVHHELHPKVVFEYILIVILGTLLSLFLFGN